MALDKKVISVITYLGHRKIDILYNTALTLSAQVSEAAVFIMISWPILDMAFNEKSWYYKNKGGKNLVK
jgi:hypothetical protein